MMIHQAFVLLLYTVYSAADHGTCSRRNLPLEEGRVSGSILTTSVLTDGPVSCARACLLRTLCESFSYEAFTGLCELNPFEATPASIRHPRGSRFNFMLSNISSWPSTLAMSCANHTCPANTICSPQLQPYCNTAGCLLSERPEIHNATLKTNISDVITPVGSVLIYNCDTGAFPTKAVCEADGSWRSTPCLVAPMSCLQVQTCLSTKEDGEYWLTLPNFDFYLTRVYCHDMASRYPTEFITLPTPNYGVFPNVSNYDCLSETSLTGVCIDREGEAWFSKIRVNLARMSVSGGDYTFVNFTQGKIVYGQAIDCYTQHPGHVLGACGTRGYFKIDLRGTGWIVHPNQTWKITGVLATIESVSRSVNGSVVELRCGGYGGGCTPRGSLKLAPNPGTIMPEPSAVDFC